MKKVLVIDDDKKIGRVLEFVFSDKDFEVTVTYSGEEAFERLEKSRPDIILLDIMMPGMDGFEVCEKIKSDERFKDIPLVVLSVLRSNENRERALSLGATDFIEKPSHVHYIRSRILEIIETAGESGKE